MKALGINPSSPQSHLVTSISLWYTLYNTDCHGKISMMLENKIYWALASLQLLGVVAAIVAVAVNVDASISLMSSNSQARSFSLSESWEPFIYYVSTCSVCGGLA